MWNSSGWGNSSGGSGENGKSAYELWLEIGNTGTLEDFMDSLKGEQGPPGPPGPQGPPGSGDGTGTGQHSLYYIPTEEDGATDPSNRVYRYWTVEELYGAWDTLMAQHPNYITRDIAPYKDYTEQWELRRYILTPEYGYDKTIYIGAGVHGSEFANKLSILRIAQLLCERWRTHPSLEYIRRRVRLVIIPIVNPYGHANSTLTNGNDTANSVAGKGTNINRNYDGAWFQKVNSGGADHNGAYPFSEPETRWVKETIEWIGPENIHYALDLHDAPSTDHGDYWINYNTFHDMSRREVKKVLLHLAEKNIKEKLGREPNLYHDKDTVTSGVFPLWAGRTMGIPASTVEHCYATSSVFDAEFMAKAVEVYINTLIAVALCEDMQHPLFKSNEEWFRVTWYKAAMEHAFIGPAVGYDNDLEYEHYPVKGKIGKWEALADKYPQTFLRGHLDLNLTNRDGRPVYWYVYQPKKPKKTILIVGGRIEAARGMEPFTYSMFRFAELLYQYGNKDVHLTKLKRNVRIVFVPFIEYGNYFLNSYGNFASDGTPYTDNTTVNNIVSLIDHIQNMYGSLDGVIYSSELNATALETEQTTDVFKISPSDIDDSLDIQSYVDFLNSLGLNGDIQHLMNSPVGEFGIYTYDKLGIPTVRIDTGLDYNTYNFQKTQFDGSTGTVVNDIPISDYLKMDAEICRRITNIVNVIKLMMDFDE